MHSSLLHRRTVLRLLLGSAAALPLSPLFGTRARAQASTHARRVIFFYTPDGVHEADWGLSGRQLGALGARVVDLVLLRGLKMSDGEGHNDGAKMLLKGSLDSPTSFDQYLASTFGSTSYYPHLYLGVQAHAAPPGSDGDDWFVSYRDGHYVAPEDNPAIAFGKLFPNGQIPHVPTNSGQGEPGEGPRPSPELLRDKSILDVVLADIHELEGKLDGENRRKLDLHLQAVREVEQRILTLTGVISGERDPDVPTVTVGNCEEPRLSFGGALYEPELFPDVLAAQMDVMVTAMACGLTRVGTLQCSRHTSPLSMPFVGSTRTMQSHEASHNDAGVFLDQRVWFFTQLKGLLDRLAARADPDVQGATLLDTTLVVSLTEIDWGPTHKHHDMPFLLAGGTGGKLRSGTSFDTAGRHHSDLMATVARALGTPASGWFGGNHRAIDELLG